MPGPLRRSADEVLDALDDAGDRIRRGLGDRQCDQADAVRDRTDAVRAKDDDLADDGPGIDPTERPTPGDAHASGAATSVLRPQIDPRKWEYIFGRLVGTRNGPRSQQMASVLARIGVHDNPDGHQLLHTHLAQVGAQNSNILETYTDRWGVTEVRDSLFAGPWGFVRLHSSWLVEGDVRRFTTLIPLEPK